MGKLLKVKFTEVNINIRIITSSSMDWGDRLAEEENKTGQPKVGNGCHLKGYLCGTGRGSPILCVLITFDSRG